MNDSRKKKTTYFFHIPNTMDSKYVERGIAYHTLRVNHTSVERFHETKMFFLWKSKRKVVFEAVAKKHRLESIKKKLCKSIGLKNDKKIKLYNSIELKEAKK